MRTGTVTEELKKEKSAPGWEDAQIFSVRCGLETVAALDLAGAAVGDRVLLSGAVPARMEAPADMAIVAVLAET